MRLIYAMLMIVGFAFLLWSIDRSMPVYADAVLTSDYPIYENLDGTYMFELELKECEEELASLRSYVDSLNWITIPEGWKVESVEGEWSEENK